MDCLFGCFPSYRIWHQKDGNMKYFLINHTQHEVFRINRKNTIFTEIEAAYKYYPKWLPTDDINIFSTCDECCY